MTRQWQGVNAAQPVVVVPTPDRPTKCDASLKATPQTKRKKREHVQHVEHDAPGTPTKKMKTKQDRTQVPDAAAKPQARGESPELGGWGVRAPLRARHVRGRGGCGPGRGSPEGVPVGGVIFLTHARWRLGGGPKVPPSCPVGRCAHHKKRKNARSLTAKHRQCHAQPPPRRACQRA